MAEDGQGDDAGLQEGAGSLRRPIPGLLKGGMPAPVETLVRMLLTVAGLVSWGLAQGLFSSFLGPFRGFIPRYAATGFLGLLPLLLVWKLVPRVAGVLGCRRKLTAAASAGALFIPFIVLGIGLGMVYQGVSSLWPLFALSLLLLAAMEEIICRGFILDTLSFHGRRMTGLLLSSAVFAVLHMSNDFASPAGIINIFLAGMLFGLMRISTDGLWVPVAAHWLWNLMTGMVFGWSVSGHELMPAIFDPASAAPWGGFGPEESVLMTVGTLGGIAILLKDIYLPDDNQLSGVHGTSGHESEEIHSGSQTAGLENG